MPTLLVCLASALTVPWSYLVLHAAYDRDVTENARALARRVEVYRMATPNDQLMVSKLSAEVESDPSVQTLIFYNVLYSQAINPQPTAVKFLAIVKKSKSAVRTLTSDKVQELKTKTIEQIDDRDTQTQQFFIPWTNNGQVVGITYVVLSNDALSAEFWKKELPLFRQVIAWSSTGILALSAVGMFAYRSWQKAGHVQQRAELARQGLMAERGLTAAVLAHEIRNPLQALRFQLHSLRKNAADAQRVTGTAETIDSELMRIQQLVTDYLAHEKAASVRVQSVNLQEAAGKLHTVMDELLRSTDTRLTVVPPPNPVNVMCDPHALRQILMNLVLNAQQAMGSGGSITIRLGEEEFMGVIEVTDTGPGISPEMQARLFKPFQTSKKEGHGIGLALVKRFVDNFGGSVAVESAIGRGTTFRLKLPVAEGGPTGGFPVTEPKIEPQAQSIQV